MPPSSGEATMSLGFLDLCDFARVAVSRGDFADARRHFEGALQIKPEAIEVLYGLGNVCYRLQDYIAARKYFEQVRDLDPSHAGAVINLGALHNVAGEYEDAIKMLRRGIQLDATRAEGFYNLGTAYRKLGKYELAIQAYREAHHLNPRMADALFQLGSIYLEMDRLDQAASHFRQAIEINPAHKKAREGLEVAERRVRESNLQARNEETDFLDEETPLEVRVDGEKLERVLNPDHDYDLLSAMHRATNDLHELASAWTKLTEDLDGCIRNLAIHMTGGHAAGGEMELALQALRDKMNQIDRTQHDCQLAYEQASKQRDLMVE